MSLLDFIPGFYIYSLIRVGNFEALGFYKTDPGQKSKWESDKEFLINSYFLKETLSPLAYAYLEEMDNEHNRNNIINLLFKDFVNVPIYRTQYKLNQKNFVIENPTPLIYALVNKSMVMIDFPDGKNTPTKVSMAKDLIQRGADVTVPDAKGNTALMVAAIYNNDIDMTKLIISKNPETLKQRNNTGFTALQLAFNASQIEIILLLIREKADVTEKYIIPKELRESNPQAKNGDTYLHVAYRKKFPLIVFTELFKHGIQADIEDAYRDPPLILMCHRMNEYKRDYDSELIKLFLENGADPNKLTDNHISGKESPIIFAVRSHNLPMAELLLRYSKKSVDEIMVGGNKLFNDYITIRRYDWMGPESQYILKARIDMVVLLLNYGAKVDKRYIDDHRDEIYKEVKDILKDVPFYSTMSALKHLGITTDPDTEKQFAEHLTKPQPTSLPESYTKQKRLIDEISKSTPLTDANVAGKQGSDMSDITPGDLRGAMHSIFNASHYLTDKEYTTKMNKLQEAFTISKKQRLGGKKTKHRQQRKNKSKRRHKL